MYVLHFNTVKEIQLKKFSTDYGAFWMNVKYRLEGQVRGWAK